MGKEAVAKVKGETLNMVEGFINDMLPKSNHLQAPTIVKDNNETINRNEIGDLDPIVWNVPTLYWKPTTSLVPMSLGEKKNGFTNMLTTMLCEIVTPTHLRREWKLGGGGGGGLSYTFTGDTDVFNLTKTKHNGKNKNSEWSIYIK